MKQILLLLAAAAALWASDSGAVDIVPPAPAPVLDSGAILPSAVTATPDSVAPAAPLPGPEGDQAVPTGGKKERKTIVRDKGAAGEKELEVITTYKGDVNELKSPKKAFFLSFLLPGLGEYYAKAHPVRIALPATIELATYITAYYFYGKYNDRTKTYQNFTDQYFDQARFKTWYDFVVNADSSQVSMQGFSHDSLYFEDSKSKNNDYYEMIAKYDMFTQGWDDADPKMTNSFMTNRDVNLLGGAELAPHYRGYAVDSVTKDGDNIIEHWTHIHPDGQPYYYGRSQHQLDAMALRDRANEMGDYFRQTFYVLMINRIVSSIDAVLAATSYNRKLTGGTLAAIDKVRLTPVRVGRTAMLTNGVAVSYQF